MSRTKRARRDQNKNNACIECGYHAWLPEVHKWLTKARKGDGSVYTKHCGFKGIQDSTRGGAASHEAAQRRQCVVQQTWRRFHTSRLSAAEGGEKEGFVSRVCQSPGSGGGAPGEGSGAVPQRGLGQRPSRSATFYALKSQRNAKKSFKNVMPFWATGSPNLSWKGPHYGAPRCSLQALLDSRPLHRQRFASNGEMS